MNDDIVLYEIAMESYIRRHAHSLRFRLRAMPQLAPGTRQLLIEAMDVHRRNTSPRSHFRLRRDVQEILLQ